VDGGKQVESVYQKGVVHKTCGKVQKKVALIFTWIICGLFSINAAIMLVGCLQIMWVENTNVYSPLQAGNFDYCLTR
jgi:hypothetical protein